MLQLTSRPKRQPNDYCLLPWREDRPQLPDNLPMAKKRLVSTERRLLKDKEVVVAYQNVLNDYLEKGYIHRMPPDEPKPECQWLLPHFPVVQPEKATAKGANSV